MRIPVLPDRVALVLITSLLLAGCGGGGGSSGSKNGGGGPVVDDSVTFLGITFKLSTGEVLSKPPLENPLASPPTLGGPLDLVTVFTFDGVPEGPFSQVTLPVFTTPAEVTVDAQAPGGLSVIPAKGTYHLVGNTVEFRPFVPTAPLKIPLSSPPAAVPGLLPGSVYTARLSTVQGAKLGNLGTVAAATTQKFGTTSNEFAFYPKDVGASAPPALASLEPADGATDFFPGVFSATAPGAGAPTFPDGDDSILVGFDRALLPTTANLMGSDLDSDGLDDHTFFIRTRATDVLVAHAVPADSLGGVHAAFPALSALDEGSAPATDGADVFLHDSPDLLDDPDAGLTVAPSSMAPGVDADVLFMVLPVDGGDDLLAVADRVSGDPSFAATGLDAPGGAPQALDTGLDELVGLTTLLDGRLVGFDRETLKIHELLPTVVRQRPTPGDDGGPPILSALTIGDGTTGFRSGTLTDPSLGVAPEVRDLLQAPDGSLYMLAVRSGEVLPSLIELQPIDFDLDGTFGGSDGLWTDVADIVRVFNADYVDAVFVGDDEILALDRSRDAIDRVVISTGVATEVISGVAGFGTLGPGETSPATALAVGHLDLEVDVDLVSNDDSAGATVRLTPKGLLPVGAPFDVMQRNTLTSLFGASAVNVTDEPVSPLGARSLATYTTAQPLAGPGVPIDDAFIETFDDQSNRGAVPLVTSVPADWAAAVGAQGGTTGGLRAAAVAAASGSLGDFLPSAPTNHDFDKAYIRADLPWPGHGNDDKEEEDIDWVATPYTTVFLNTDAQVFPLNDGSTPGVTSPITINNGRFVFRDFIIPAGVRVVVKGSNPLRIVATRKVEIHGALDISGTDGFGDDSFDSGFLPVPGGPAGPGGGRGGTAHPTLFDPNGPGSINQYVTPEKAENGFAPITDSSGAITLKPVGGRGGLSTVGFDPDANGYPKLPPAQNNGPIPSNEHHRPPGGGGGTFYGKGVRAREGTGAYLVESNSTWFPFSKCTVNDKIQDTLYGNEENFWSGADPSNPLQCVYLVGTPSDPERLKPGGEPGDPVFLTATHDDDYYGKGGEIPSLRGGQGGGGGATRVDSAVHNHWSQDKLATPLPVPPSPQHYPALFIGVLASPTLYDAKGGGGGGGGGAVEITSFGGILISRTGHIDATGGHGGGGEVVQNGNNAGGGGGGSGGLIALRAAEDIIVQADATHLDASYIDFDGDQGASLEVSGGFGRDSHTETPSMAYTLHAWTYEYTRSDAGQGGMGMIQLQPGTNGGMPIIEQGAFLFAKIRTIAKLGSWTGDTGLQEEHPDWPVASYTDEMRYIDMLHYPLFEHQPGSGGDRYFVVNGSYPPLIPRTEDTPVVGFSNEFPVGSGDHWLDTAMTTVGTDGVPVVREPIPSRIMESYAGYDPNSFVENGSPPGATYAADAEIPLSVLLQEPDGTPYMAEGESGPVFDPRFTIDRLPVVPPSRTPPPFGSTSHGVSRWFDFHGVALRDRQALTGRTPPFFEPVNGTYNLAQGAVPAGKDGQVVLGGDVPGVPARYVTKTGLLDPGLFGGGTSDPPFNDIGVDAPEFSLQHAVTDNATVTLLFQGAYPVRAGSQVADTTTQTAWVSDLTLLDGYPLVRFQVLFDLGADEVNHPFSSESLRPKVDYVRFRADY